MPKDYNALFRQDPLAFMKKYSVVPADDTGSTGDYLGDLNQQSFKEVFFGPKAQSFRDSLAKGKLPIRTCAHCGDLKRIKKSKLHEIKPRLPYRGMLLENTVRCNIDCIGCDRIQAAGLRKTKQMELDKVAKMADLVKELGLQQLFYLHLGEPFLSPNIGK